MIIYNTQIVFWRIVALYRVPSHLAESRTYLTAHEDLNQEEEAMEEFFEIMRQIQAAFEQDRTDRFKEKQFFYKTCITCATKGGQSMRDYLDFLMNHDKLREFTKVVLTGPKLLYSGVMGAKVEVTIKTQELPEPEITGFWKQLLLILEENGMNRGLFLCHFMCHLQEKYGLEGYHPRCIGTNEGLWIVQYILENHKPVV